jgi:uncharacterized phage-like protein YoqJ
MGGYYHMATISFTGHRPQKLGGFKTPNPIYDFVIASIEEALVKLAPTKAISGMALGVDIWAAEICLKLGIPLIAAVPFVGQEKIWPQESQDKYHAVLNQAAEKVIVCEGGYASWKMQKRNQWMVDHSDLVIAVYDGSTGGTGNCVSYAKQQNKNMIIINPIEKTIDYSGISK